MSYLVLARKYRPRSFLEMVGQEHVVQALGNALTQQRLHHAYLFTGTRGVGKTTVSRILAKSLNCQGPDGQGGITAEPCGVCQACTDIDAGRFVDYTELDAASNRGVDEVQSLLEQAVYKPVQGRFKVFMIDEVHMLSNTAFNAMLKTLEEPPEYLKFVLATTDPQKVPVTVLSRCLQFNLRPMAPETIHEHLVRVLGAEGVAAESGALQLLARAARGSMRDALSLTDQAIAFGSGQLSQACVQQMLGSVDQSHVLDLIEALSQGDGARAVALVDALRVQGFSAAGALEDMTQWLQRMAVRQMAPAAAPESGLQEVEAERLAGLAQALPAQETQLLYSLCLHGRAELGLAPDEYSAMQMVLLRWLAFKLSGPAEKKSPESGLSAVSDRTPASSPASPEPMTASATAHTATAAQAPAGRSLPPSRPAVPPASAPATPAPDAPGAALSAAAGDPPALKVLPVVDRPLSVSVPPVEGGRLAASERAARPLPVRQTGPASPRAEGLREAATPLPLTLTPLGDRWMDCVQQMIAAEAIHALVRELALQCQLMACDDSVWSLQTEMDSLNSANHRDRLQLALAGIGHAVSLQVQTGPVQDTPSRRMAAKAAEQMNAARALMEGDPDVQALMQHYEAKIVPGSLQVL